MNFKEYLLENSKVEELMKNEKLSLIDLFIACLLDEIESTYDVLQEFKPKKDVRLAIEEIFGENYNYKHIIKLIHGNFILTYLEKRDFIALFGNSTDSILLKDLLKNIGINNQVLKSFLVKLTFNEDIDVISSLNFKNILKNHEKIKINYSGDFELN